jgi:hypothetical protein
MTGTPAALTIRKHLASPDLPQAVATGSLNRFFKLEETPVNRWDLS